MIRSVRGGKTVPAAAGYTQYHRWLHIVDMTRSWALHLVFDQLRTDRIGGKNGEADKQHREQALFCFEIKYDPREAEGVEWQPEQLVAQEGKQPVEEGIGPSAVDPVHQRSIPCQERLHHRLKCIVLRGKYHSLWL